MDAMKKKKILLRMRKFKSSAIKKMFAKNALN